MQNGIRNALHWPVLLCLLLLSACNLPTGPASLPTSTPDQVATQVSLQLTNLPAEASPTAALPPVASATPQPSFTPAPSLTPQPSPSSTANPGDPATSLGAPTWQDSLDTGKNFYLYENDNTKIEAGDGKLELTGLTANGWLGWSLTYSQPSTNFYLEGTFQTRDCSANDIYGLVFRASKDNAGYFYGVTCDGRFNLWTRDFNKYTNAEILSLRQSRSIVSGSNQTNKLGILAQGDKISLYVNGTLVTETNDATYKDGYFGVFVAANSTPKFRVDLDRIALWKLP